MTRTTRLLVPAAAFLLLACDKQDGSDVAFVRDSAGIAIIENRTPEWSDATAWRIEAQPILSLTARGDSPEYQLFRVVSAVGASDGSIVVADGGSHTLRWYGSDGAHLSTAGGQGSGPGEFQAISWMGVSESDTAYTWDGEQGRVSLFVRGRFVRDYQLEHMDRWPLLVMHGRLTNGKLASMAIVPAAREPGRQRLTAPVLLVSPVGGAELHLGDYPGTEVEYAAAATAGAVIRRAIPFGPTTLLAARGNRVVIGDNARNELEVFDETGTGVQLLRFQWVADPVTAEDLAQELERRLSEAPPIEEIREGIRAAFAATTPPATKPFYDQLLIDTEGFLWVRRGTPARSQTSDWDVVAPSGQYLGRLRIPAALRLTHVGPVVILGVWKDDDGVEDVRAYRLHRTSRDGR